MSKHPIQPVLSVNNVLRFKENAIVSYLLDNGGITLNDIAFLDFSDEDREQFAQLIGYSLSGFGDLYYTSNKTYETAVMMYETGKTEIESRNDFLEETITELKDALREPMAALFGVSPEDLV